MAFPDQDTDATRKLAAYLGRLEARIAKLEAGFVIPVLDADPPAGDPTNLWMLNDGRMRGRSASGTVFQYTAVTPTAPAGSSVPKPAPVVVKQFQSIYTANDSASYCPTHGVETALFYGTYVNNSHPERRVMFGFDDATIRTDLSGATIRSVQLKMQNLHSWNNSGVQVYFGAHNVDVLGPLFSQAYKPFWSDAWPKVGGDTWRPMGSMGLWVGNAFRDNLIKGLTIDQPSESNSFYGQAHPNLQLAITYTK